MTMLELSYTYQDSAELLRRRVQELRASLKRTADREEARCLQARVNALTPLLRETRELAYLTAHYYDRRYHISGRYTI